MSVSFRPQKVISSGGGGYVIKIVIVHKNQAGMDISKREAVAKVVRKYDEGENEMKILKIIGTGENKHVIEFIGNMPCQDICMNGIVQFIRESDSKIRRARDLQFMFPQLLMLEYVDTITYKQYLRGGDTLIKLKSILENILDGLAYIHSRGVVHNDIKPKNILLNKTGDTKITDFGNSFLMTDKKQLENISAGTPVYTAPEVLLLNSGLAQTNPITPLVDIWSLGIMIVEILTDALPFDNAGSLMKITTDIIMKEPIDYYTKSTLKKIKDISSQLYDFIFYGCLIRNTNAKVLPCRCSASDLLNCKFLKC